jgi:hypothetical protein
MNGCTSWGAADQNARRVCITDRWYKRVVRARNWSYTEKMSVQCGCKLSMLI